jgi:hypothetical protein
MPLLPRPTGRTRKRGGLSPSLEERVAALEATHSPPALVMEPEWTREQHDEFMRLWHEMTGGPWEHRELPPRPLLTPETARELLRECVTIVKPGETLVIRAADSWTAMQVRELQDVADMMAEDRNLGFAILCLPGEEFAVATAPADPEPSK